MIDTASNQYHILYVDDEVKALRYFKQCFEDEYIIHTATNAEEGFHILETYGTRIGILLTDQRMPGESGVELMERAPSDSSESHPHPRHRLHGLR